MKIVCSKCGHGMESVIVDRELAVKELYELSMKHMLRQHPKLFEELKIVIQKCTAAFVTIMHWNECVVVPQDEEYLNKKLEESQDVAMAALGFDPDEEEDEDDEDENDEVLSDDEPEIEPGVIEFPSESDKGKLELVQTEKS